jgi:hypothetical protein
MFIIYIFIAFIVFFFTYKKYIEALRGKISVYEPCFEHKEFWIISLVPLFWVLSLPMIIMWKILDEIYNKLNKNK